MNEWLAQYFGTGPQTQPSEDQIKQAQVEFFVEMAKESGVDLGKMNDQEIDALFADTMSKLAEEEGKEDEEKKQKLEAAKREHEEKKEGEAKIASMLEEGTLMGQIIAHSFSAELDKVAASKQAAGFMSERHIENRAEAAAHKAEGAEAAQLGASAHGGPAEHNFRIHDANLSDRRTRMRKLRAAASEHYGKARGAVSGAAKATGAAIKAHPYRTAGGAAGAAALLTGGAALAAHHHHHKKEASALDELAAEAAVSKVASAGWDANEAAERMFSVLTLDMAAEENSKVAAADGIDQAIEIRALELAEAAGYPVNWA